MGRGVLAGLILVGLLLGSAGSAAAVPENRWQQGYAVTVRVGVYPDRGDEPWYCGWQGIGCGELPTRPFDSGDRPLYTVPQGWTVTINCRKGHHYLVRLSGHRWGWAVVDLGVRAYPPTPPRVTGPEYCQFWDEAP